MKTSERLFLVLFLVLIPVSASAEKYFMVSLGMADPVTGGYENDSTLKLGFGTRESDESLEYEISYVNLGKFEADSGKLVDISNVQGAPVTSASIKISGLDLSVLGDWDLNERFAIYGRIGVYLWDAEGKADSPVLGPGGFDEDGNDVSFGFGLKWGWTGQTGLTFGFDQYEALGGDTNVFSAGIKSGF